MWEKPSFVVSGLFKNYICCCVFFIILWQFFVIHCKYMPSSSKTFTISSAFRMKFPTGNNMLSNQLIALKIKPWRYQTNVAVIVVFSWVTTSIFSSWILHSYSGLWASRCLHGCLVLFPLRKVCWKTVYGRV